MALAHSPRIVTDGLVLCLDAANPKSYPGTGTTWFDLSGNENNFTMIGTLSFSNGVFTSTATTANYFIRNPFNHPTTAVTIEMWCLANSGTSDDGIWSYAVSGIDNHQLLFSQQNLALYGPNAVTNVSSGVNVADGNWKQIVRTSNRSNGAEVLYVNGVERFTTTMNSGTNFTSGGSLVLAQEQDSVGGGLDATQALQGRYTIFRIYNRVLTAQEIQQNYNALKSRYFGYQTVVYTASANMTLTNNGTQDVTMFKTSDNNSWNGEVRSTESFSAPCTIEFSKQAGTTDNGVSYLMIGWNEDPTTNTSYTSLDHASYPYQQNSYVVYNNGSLVHNSGVWDQNKRFYIVYDTDGFIRHYNGSTLLYSANYGTNKTVFVDSSFYSVNSTFGGLTNVKVARSSWNGFSYV